MTATVGLTTRAAGVIGWQYGVKHDPGLLTLDTLTLNDTDAQGTTEPRPCFCFFQIVEDGGARVGFLQVVILNFWGGDAQVPTDQEFFSLAFVGYTVSPDACLPDVSGNLASAIEFTEELSHEPGKPQQPLQLVIGGVLVDFNVIPTTAVIRCEEDPAFRRGDTNADGAVNLTDAIFTLGALFLGEAAPSCADAADADDSGSINVTDAVFVLNYLFGIGAAPNEPFGTCGVDPTVDPLDCAAFAPCP